MAVRFKVDENVPLDAKSLLEAAGHDAESVHDEGLAGHPDASLLNACRREGRVLVTLDLDFADIRQHPPSSHEGIWVLRPPRQSIRDTLAVLTGALSLVSREETHGRLWIVEPRRVRIRE